MIAILQVGMAGLPGRLYDHDRDGRGWALGGAKRMGDFTDS
jgi:hypothetical protein